MPALASKWTVSDDGLEYIFTVREGVEFHDGQRLTPSDVAWSLQTRRSTPTWVESARLAKLDKISLDGQKVTLTLSSPDSNLLWTLSGRAGLVLKEGDAIDYKTTANGTGPFQVESWRQGDSISFSRNDSYWGDRAGVGGIVLKYISDDRAALNAALAGEVDALTGFDANLTSQIEASGDYEVTLGPSTDKGTLAFNQRSGPLADQRVRMAIRHAIDHDAFIESGQSGSTLYGPIPSLDPGFSDLSAVAPYDPDKARALLAEAGQTKLGLTLTIPNVYSPTIPQILVSNLKDVGITIDVEQVDFGTWLNDVYTNKDYELSFVMHTEARDFENWANPDYYYTYDNPDVQRLFEDAVASTDETISAGLLARAARVVSEDAAGDWLYSGSSVVAVRRGLTGFPTVNVNERLNLAELSAG